MQGWNNPARLPAESKEQWQHLSILSLLLILHFPVLPNGFMLLNWNTNQVKCSYAHSAMVRTSQDNPKDFLPVQSCRGSHTLPLLPLIASSPCATQRHGSHFKFEAPLCDASFPSMKIPLRRRCPGFPKAGPSLLFRPWKRCKRLWLFEQVAFILFLAFLHAKARESQGISPSPASHCLSADPVVSRASSHVPAMPCR